MKKKVMALVMVAALACVMAVGCGKKKETTTEAPTEATTTEAPTEATTTEAPTEATTTEAPTESEETTTEAK